MDGNILSNVPSYTLCQIKTCINPLLFDEFADLDRSEERFWLEFLQVFGSLNLFFFLFLLSFYGNISNTSLLPCSFSPFEFEQKLTV